jgi:hypothetical protein
MSVRTIFRGFKMKNALVLFIFCLFHLNLSAEYSSPSYLQDARKILDNQNESLSYERAVNILVGGESPSAEELNELNRLYESLFKKYQGRTSAFDKYQETGALKPMDWSTYFEYKPIDFIRDRKEYRNLGFEKPGAHPENRIFFDIANHPELVARFAENIKSNHNFSNVIAAPSKSRKSNIKNSIVFGIAGAALWTIDYNFVTDGLSFFSFLISFFSFNDAVKGHEHFEKVAEEYKFLKSLDQWQEKRGYSCKHVL